MSDRAAGGTDGEDDHPDGEPLAEFRVLLEQGGLGDRAFEVLTD